MIQNQVQNILMKQKVESLPSLPLKQSETNWLSKGLNFSPVPLNINKYKFNRGMDNLGRTLGLKLCFWRNLENQEPQDTLTPTPLDKLLKKEKAIQFNLAGVNCIKT